MPDVEIVVEGVESQESYGIIREVLEDAARRLDPQLGDDLSLTVLLAGDDTISRLHEEFFRDDSTTDVMSFPANNLPALESAYLGDIAISVPVADRQAREHGHSTVREVAFLALHGLLHLLGYDDLDPAEREVMLRKQTELLESYERQYGAL